MRHQVQDKLITFLVQLVDFTESIQYHYWFALFLEKWYAIELKDTKNFHQN